MGKDFEKSEFNDICPVYSIWILMNMPENSLTYVHLTQEQLMGSLKLAGKDIFNIIYIGLTKRVEEPKGEQDLHRLLGVLLLSVLDVKEKLGIIEAEYEIPIEDEVRRELDLTCNLSEGIWEEALLEGKAEGKAEIILQMNRKGLTAKEIASMLDQEEIKVILEGDPALV